MCVATSGIITAMYNQRIMVYDMLEPVPRKDEWLLGHYHGDTVRRLFLAGAIVVLLALPFGASPIPQSVALGIVLALALTLFAGLTNPRERWVVFADVLIAAIAFLFFENAAIRTFIMGGMAENIVFYLQQALAINFLAALYFSTKTLRGMLTRPRQ